MEERRAPQDEDEVAEFWGREMGRDWDKVNAAVQIAAQNAACVVLASFAAMFLAGVSEVWFDLDAYTSVLVLCFLFAWAYAVWIALTGPHERMERHVPSYLAFCWRFFRTSLNLFNPIAYADAVRTLLAAKFLRVLGYLIPVALFSGVLVWANAVDFPGSYPKA